MIGVGAPIFVVIPDESKAPVFHPGRVLEIAAESFKAAFDHMTPPNIGIHIKVYSEVDSKFYQQEAIVKAVGNSNPYAIISFQFLGAPESAEKRASFRIRTVRVSIAGRIGDELKCKVTDISAEGFAAITAKAMEIGSLINVHLTYESEVLEGQARVQCTSVQSNGKHRCGFMIPENNTKMRRILERITSKVQRMHLRTHAKSAPIPTWWNR
jgi:hypothetical protein